MTKINQNAISSYPSHSNISNITEVLRIRGGSGKKRPAAGTAEGKPKRAKSNPITDEEIIAFNPELFKELDIKPQSITSIFGKRDDKKIYYQSIVSTLADNANKEALKELIGSGKLIPDFKSFASILRGSGTYAPVMISAFIKELDNNKEKLKKLIGIGKLIPDFKSFASILHGSGKDALRALTNFLTDENINNLKSLNEKYHILLISSGIKAPERIKDLLMIQEHETKITPEIIEKIFQEIG